LKVLLVGISTRALAQSAVRAGAEVISLDFFGDQDQPPGAQVLALGRDLQRPLTLAALAAEAAQRAGDCEAILVESGLENEPALLELGRPHQRMFNPARAVQWVRDLRRLGPVLAGSGLLLPEIVTPGEALPRSGEWLVKDGRHSGGQGVQRWNGRDAPGEAQLLERFVPGELYSACFLANGERARLLGMTRQYAGVEALAAPAFAWCGNVAPLIDADLERLLGGALEQVVRSSGLVGLNGLDFILGPGGPVLLEINPRPPASFELFERLLGINAFQLHLDGCRGRLPSHLPRPFQGRVWARGILYAREDWQAGDTSLWAAQGLADIPHPGERIPAGAPVCSILSRAGDLASGWQAVLERARSLEQGQAG